MFDLNIIWKSKYYDYFGLEHQMYVRVVEDWIQQKRSGMNGYERMLFWLFKKQNKVGKISTQRSGVG